MLRKNVKTMFISCNEISIDKKVIYKNDYRKIHTENINSIDVDNDILQLESFIKQNYQGIHSEKFESIDISTDEIRYESQITKNDHSDYTKEVNDEMKYRNNILPTILNKIMNILLKKVRTNAHKY